MTDKETAKKCHNIILNCYVSHSIVVLYHYHSVQSEFIAYIITVKTRALLRMFRNMNDLKFGSMFLFVTDDVILKEIPVCTV